MARHGSGRPFRRSALVIAVLAATSVSALLATPAARAEISYTGHAEAYGLRVTVANPAIPLGLVIEGDSPVAVADLSSLGDSRALAAGPFPGTTAATTPGAAGGVVGVPLPNYPVVASATAGDRPVEQDLPGLALHAEAAARRASSLATLGSASQGSQTRSTVDSANADAVGVTAEATSRLEALAVLDYLHVQRVLSHAVTTLEPSGKLSSTADLRIDGISAPGLRFTIPPRTPGAVPLPGGGETVVGPELGFRDGAFAVTLPGDGAAQQVPVPFDTVAAAFKAIGVTMTYQQARASDTGIVAPILTFDTTFPAPEHNPLGVDGPTPVRIELGRTQTSIAGSAGQTGLLTQGTGSTQVPRTLDIAGTPTGGSDGAVPAAVSGINAVSDAGPTPGPPAALILTGGTRAGRTDASFSDLYGLFLAAAFAVFVAGPAATYLGRRSRWLS